MAVKEEPTLVGACKRCRMHPASHNVHRQTSFQTWLTGCMWFSTNCHDSLCTEGFYLTHSVLALLPLSTFHRGTTSYSFCRDKRQACRTHAILSTQHIHHPSYLHDRNHWFGYYITTGQWFMPCWSYRTDGWYALYPWPSWFAASPADLSVGKHTPTRACSVQSKPTTYYTSRPKNKTQAICKFRRDRCVGDRKREEWAEGIKCETTEEGEKIG